MTDPVVPPSLPVLAWAALITGTVAAGTTCRSERTRPVSTAKLWHP